MNGWRGAVHLFACAIGLRVLLLHVGVGDQLGWRVETATPANSLLGVREGLTHAQHGISPYRGQACHTPPLVLWLHKAWALHPTLYAVPNIAWDVLAALMLLDTGRRLELYLEAAPARTSAGPAPSSTQPSFPLLLAGLYLLNPLTLALALATYSCPQSGLLLLAVALLLASDWSLAEHPDAPCLPGMRQGLSWLWAVPMRLRPAVTPHLSKQSTLGLDPLLLAPGPAAAAGQPYPNPSTPASPHTGRCWALHVYQLPLLVEDIQPNIGQLWYFFTQMFPQYLAFFRFVTHSLSAVMVVPLALRFPRRPLLLFTAQCITAAMWKPYPSVADLALYMALLPLLRPQLRRMQTGVLLAGSFLLLAVLEPAMWHQWVEVESANSNFYYSITLLLGAWHVLLLVQLLLLTVQVEGSTKPA
ncbi:GPI transamidase subunit PIG-U-domain-containing protein [Haematococcus lacustris]